MLRFGWIGAAALVAGGCKEAEIAPLSLGDASLYLFSGFEGEVEPLASAILDLEREALAVDLNAPPRDRAYTIPKLTSEYLGGVTAPPETDPENQVTTVLLGRSVRTAEQNLQLVGEVNQVCIESDTTVSATRTFSTDLEAFLDGSEEFLRTENETRKENILAKAWYDLFKDFRRVTLEDGREAIVARAWTEEVFYGDGGNTNFAQNYTAEVWIPDGDTTLRAYAMWAEINIGLGDDAMQGLIIDGLGESIDNSDGFIVGELSEDCAEHRDEVYTRE